MLSPEQQQEVRTLCEIYNVPSLSEVFISNNVAPREVALHLIRAKETAKSNRIQFIEDEADKFRRAVSDAIAIRAGIRIADPAPGARDLAGYKLREIAYECLHRYGASRKGPIDDVLYRAMTTTDFPLILQDSARKALLAGFESEAETWRVWCDTGVAKDFKQHKIVQASVSEDLDEVDEHQPYPYGEASEKQETYSLATYGKIFAITRQAIINDDLEALTSVPKVYGEAAARKIGDLVYAVLTSNPTMGDGTALFHSSHGNIGTAGTVSETTIAEAIKLMRLQKDIDGKRRLNIRPQYFIAPVALEGTAEIFFNSNQFAGSDTGATRNNPYAGTRFTRVYDARLDDNSTTAWYMAGPKGKTVTVFFLSGIEEPQIKQQPGWLVDGIEYKVTLDAAVKAVDWRALVKNPGA